MSKRLYQFENNIPYHVFNRGYNKQKLFFDNQDYERFERLIKHYKLKFNIKIWAYCVLPNHFHLLTVSQNPKTGLANRETGLEVSETGLENDVCKISDFMHRIQVAYAMYFNAKYKDTIKKGLKSPVFEGRFKSRVVTDESYLSDLRNYIEFNAVKHKLVINPTDWKWSSYNLDSIQNFDLQDDFEPFFE